MRVHAVWCTDVVPLKPAAHDVKLKWYSVRTPATELQSFSATLDEMHCRGHRVLQERVTDFTVRYIAKRVIKVKPRVHEATINVPMAHICEHSVNTLPFSFPDEDFQQWQDENQRWEGDYSSWDTWIWTFTVGALAYTFYRVCKARFRA